MSLLKARRKKSMREHYIKPPAEGTTTAYIYYQYYDRTAKRTKGIPYVSFNLATNPEAPETNITDNGKVAGYTLSTEHLTDIKRWLKKHGTFGKPKVPPRALARIRAEVEYKVRAELGAPPSMPNPAKTPVARTANEKIRALCKATDELLEHITKHATPKESLLGITPQELFALRLHLNFGEKALRQALRSASITATDFAAAALLAEADEARRRGYIKQEDIDSARLAKARSEASKAAKTRTSISEQTKVPQENHAGAPSET